MWSACELDQLICAPRAAAEKLDLETWAALSVQLWLVGAVTFFFTFHNGP
jgi:hypothetical protein